MIKTRPSTDPRWEPFRAYRQGVVWASDRDLFVGRRRDITAKIQSTYPTQLDDLFVFGRLRFLGTNATLAFRTIYVFGTLESEGVALQAARVVLMTPRQFSQGLGYVQRAPVSKPVDLDHGETIRLSLTGCKKFCLSGDINQSINGSAGFTGLIWAVHCNDAQLVKLFIRAEANLEARWDQWTALGWAAQKGYLVIAHMLVQAGAQAAPVLEELQKHNYQYALIELKAILRKNHRDNPYVHQMYTHSPMQNPLPTITKEQRKPKRNQQIVAFHERLDFTALNLANTAKDTHLAIYNIATALTVRRTRLTSGELLKLRKKVLNNVIVTQHCTNPRMINAILLVNQQAQRLLPLQRAVAA